MATRLTDFEIEQEHGGRAAYVLYLIGRIEELQALISLNTYKPVATWFSEIFGEPDQLANDKHSLQLTWAALAANI